MNYQNLNYKNNSTIDIQNPKRTINNELKENNVLSNNNINSDKNFTTNTRYYKKERNNYNKFKDLRNNVEFYSFNRNDYIKEANKIMLQRLGDKNAEL